MAANSYPLPKPVRPIGVPYQGTHSTAFNKKDGSDNWESENAVDLPTPKGTPVYAVTSGVIGPQIGSLGSNEARMAGLRLHLVTQNNEYYYAHLSKLVVTAGETVQAGQLLGYSGVANGVAHLHFAAKTGDPRSAFGAAPPDTTVPPQQTADDTTAAPPPEAAPVDSPPVVSQAPLPVAPTTAQLPVAPAGEELPGSVTILPRRVAQMWQQIAAATPVVSPETESLAANAAVAAGGLS